MTSELKLRLETEKPSESVQKKAFVELRETPENIEKGLKELKTLLQAETDLVAPLDNEEWLLLFLRTCKFYPESARDLVKRFFNVRRKYPEVQTALTPTRLKPIFDARLSSILPQRDQHGRRIIVLLSGKHFDYRTHSLDDLFSTSILCQDILQKEPETQINGLVYILDLEGFSFGHVLLYNIYVLRRFVDFVQEGVPYRIKGFHIVNQPSIFKPVFAIAKKFFSDKFAKRVILHGSNYESLHQYVSPECLPKCYGGALKSKLDYSQETYEMLLQHEDFCEYYRSLPTKSNRSNFD